MRPPGWWFDGGAPPLHARMMSVLYGAAVALRRGAYRRGLLRARKAGVPVIVVGNLVAGGSGKTPLACAIVERLRDAGWTPGVASRGYGRSGNAARWVEAGSTAAEVGDEPLLIARRTGAKLRVDADRAAAARALAQAGCDVVVCDDGLQHYRLARDVEIEVQDMRRRHGNGLLLPAGPLREPPERADRCDFRVLNLGVEDEHAAGAVPAGTWPMRLHADAVHPLHGGHPRPLSMLAGQRAHAVAGIGDPARFFDMLRARGIELLPHAFPDHHAYTPRDLEFGDALPVLMTEKDAVKCAGFAGPQAYMVPVDAVLPDAFWEALLGKLPRR